MKGNFNKIINGEKPVLIDFFATWCGPCKAQEPIVKSFAAEQGDTIRVLKVDIDKNQDIANRFGIRGVPTIALFKDGKLCYKHSGVHSLKQLKELVEENLSTH